ncbi:hypothetical protein [Brevibacterium casei]|uniref:hypothetical protein n=1 Tax=Brevibacterium casei TaxID=33889 RepID=UPI0028AE333D|nr:hypothetical protein [Brevibacterium casei]
MTAKNTDKRIVEALNGTADDRTGERIRGALDGREYLYGLPEPEVSYDDSVRAWAAKESLKGAAERYARAGTTRMSDLHVEQIVSEAYGATNPEWSDLDRLERTATVVNRLAAQNERIAK